MAPGLAMLTHKVSGFDPGLVGQGFSSLLVPRVGYLFFFFSECFHFPPPVQDMQFRLIGNP